MTSTANPKCIIILSTKSSGSSALQNFLASQVNVSHVTKTRHGENETLYWVKAASILELPQVEMYDSEVPIPKKRARNDLIQLLVDNLEDSYSPPGNDEELIFNGWRLLCYQFRPVFIEKSPHHLHQYSSLELISRFIKNNPDIDFFIIGLIRNPMDTVYSMWKRWQGLPERNQFEWYHAYRNLMKFKEESNPPLKIIRYEDLVQNSCDFGDLFAFLAVDSYDKSYFHKKSLAKWKQDAFFGFKLDDKVVALAENFGYKKESLVNSSKFIWPFHKFTTFYIFRTFNKLKKSARKVKNRMFT